MNLDLQQMPLAQQIDCFKCAESSLPIYHQRFSRVTQLAGHILENCGENFIRCYGQIIETLKTVNKPDGQPYSNLTRKNWFDVIDKYITYHVSNDVSSEGMEVLDYYRDEIHAIEAEYRNREKKPGFTVEEVLRAIESLDPISKESVLIRLYLEVPVRDDFQLALISEEDLSTADPKQNYLIPCPEQHRLKVLIQKSKNVSWDKKQKPRLYTLSKLLTRDILRYLARQNINPGAVFGRGKLYKVVGQILKQVGLKSGRDSINLLRGAVATTAKLSGDNTEIAQAANRSLHSVATSELYERKTSHEGHDSDLGTYSNS